MLNTFAHFEDIFISTFCPVIVHQLIRNTNGKIGKFVIQKKTKHFFYKNNSLVRPFSLKYTVPTVHAVISRPGITK